MTVSRKTAPYGPFLQPRQACRYFLLDPASPIGSSAVGRGEPMMLIARSAGVSVREVRRVTDGQGPFPRSRHTRSLAVGKDTVQEWVARRRAGESAASIARTEKLSARLVRERLAPHEPREGPARV